MRVFLAVLFSIVMPSCAMADAVSLPVGAITLSNLQAWYWPDGPFPQTCWTTFLDHSANRASTSPQVGFSYSDRVSEDSSHYQQASLVFSGGVGFPSVDFARLYPVQFLGGERWYSLSFDWRSDLRGAGTDRICLSSYADWSIMPGAGQQSGHVDLTFALRDNVQYGSPWFAVTVVPEPSSLVALCVPLVGYLLANRRTWSG